MTARLGRNPLGLARPMISVRNAVVSLPARHAGREGWGIFYRSTVR